MQTTEDYAKSIVIWDNAHRLELAYKDLQSNIKWLSNFDGTLEKSMYLLRKEKPRNDLLRVCVKKFRLHFMSFIYSQKRDSSLMRTEHFKNILVGCGQ